MAEIRQGSASVTLPDATAISERAGKLSADEIKREAKARPGVGLACSLTAEAMVKYPLLCAIHDVTPEALREAERQIEAVQGAIADLEALLATLKQASLLASADAHRKLGKVIRTVRAIETVDAGVVRVVPQLVSYFATPRLPEEEGGEGSEE
jgi:hypothetical protein